MNYSQILKHSWKILWSYRTLWIFGIILAITSPRSGGNGSGGGGSGNNSGHSIQIDSPADIWREMSKAWEQFNEWLFYGVQPRWITIAVIAVIVSLLLAIGLTFLHFISKTALIRMVDQYETTGEKVSWRRGFAMGWNRSAWRLFLVNLAIYVPLVGVFIGLFACAFLPMLLGVYSIDVLTWTGVVGAIGLLFLVIFVIILVALVLALVMEMIYRVVVLEKTGVIEGIQKGLKLARLHTKDIVVMWLILVGIQLGFMIAIIPILFVFGAVGLLVGGGSGVGFFYLLQATMNTTTGWVGGAILAFLVLAVLVGIPMAFLGGLLETYLSTTWTLVYRSTVKPVILDDGIVQ